MVNGRQSQICVVDEDKRHKIVCRVVEQIDKLIQVKALIKNSMA
jgi:hypothetical protein